MEILSLNEIESIDHEQNSIVIYFDSSNEYNDIIEDFKIQLHEINKSLIIHTELESCINFIKLNEQKHLILIISNSSISQILSHIINLHQINSIFIFGLKKDQFKYSFLINLKIIGIYDKIDLLYISFKERFNLIEKRTHPCCFFDQIKYENKDLSKQSNDFL